MGFSVPGIGVPGSGGPGHSTGGHPAPAASAGLTFVAEAGEHCRIYRDTAGGYLVRSLETAGPERWGQLRRVATLACAYSLCQELEGRMAGAQALLRR